MSQFDIGDINPDDTTGTELADSLLEPWRDALHSMHRGSSRPSYAVGGMLWIDDSSTPWLLKLYTGNTDAVIGTVNPSNGNVQLRADVISESSSDTGVTIDGVTLRDTAVVAGSPTGGNQGSGSVNAEKMYEQGGRLLGLGQAGPLYTGWVSGDASTPSINNGPTGWTVSRVNAGDFDVAHGLNLSDVNKLIPVGLNAMSATHVVQYLPGSSGADTARLKVTDDAGADADVDFQFALLNAEAA